MANLQREREREEHGMSGAEQNGGLSLAALSGEELGLWLGFSPRISFGRRGYSCLPPRAAG